jgi:hypothetical protein
MSWRCGQDGAWVELHFTGNWLIIQNEVDNAEFLSADKIELDYIGM